MPIAPAYGQPDFQPLPEKGQFRDVLLDDTGSRMFLAVYDRNEVLYVDSHTGRTLGRVQVGKGPSALALSKDGQTLACVNRLEATLTLVGLQPFEVLATVACEEGASAVAALHGGGFAVTNSFADSVTLVDTERREVVAVLHDISSVPNGVAASEDFLAVTTLEPPSVVIFERGERTPTATLPLEDRPKSIAAGANNEFVVATSTRIIVVDAALQLRSAEIGFVANDVAVFGSRIVASRPGAIDVFDASLKKQDSYPVNASGWAVAAGGDSIAVVSPSDKAAFLSGPASAALASLAPFPEPEALVEEPLAPAGDLPQKPKVAEQTPAETVATVEPTQAPSPEELEIEPTSKKSRRREGRLRRPSPSPIGVFESHAPRLGRYAQAAAEAPRQTFQQAVAQSISVGPDTPGFQAPDMSQPMEDVEADTWRHIGDTDEWEGNVKLRLDNTFIEADKVTFKRDTGEIHAVGSVIVTQKELVLTADTLFYRIPPAAETPAPSPFGPPLDEEAAERQRMNKGRVEAENVHLTEPFREIEAKYIVYDLGTHTGEFLQAHGRAGPIYFSAESLEMLGPDVALAHDVWATTCERDPPHFRVRMKTIELRQNQVALGTNARLQIGRVATPLFIPRWRTPGYLNDRHLALDFDTGRESGIGYFLNVANWYHVSPDIDLAFRVMPTEKEGVGGGIDIEYDFRESPASPFFRSHGTLRTLYTSKDRGYTELYHRQDFREDVVVLGQWEQWYDSDFLKDFFYDRFRDRTGPRTFIDITHTAPGQITSLTAAPSTHGFTRETEKLPELRHHVLERNIGKNFYFSFDTITGYYERPEREISSTRSVNVARFTYDWNINEGFNITPFAELETSWYSDALDGDDEFRFTGVAGLTLQARLSRTYKGIWGFSAFRHIFVPSITYSYRPSGSLDFDETPQFDTLDRVPGRSRIESKIESIILGRNAETDEVWPVMRISLYQGNDFSNEVRKSEDYEIEIDVRPRPWWGILTVIERSRGGLNRGRRRNGALGKLDEMFFNRVARRLGAQRHHHTSSNDLDRVLSFIYYDNTTIGGNLNGRLGFAFTETEHEIFNREILYGLGYRVNENWGLAFEHRYDFARDRFVRQTYEVRRRLHKWEVALNVRDRESGFDLGVEFSLIDFPGASASF